MQNVRKAQPERTQTERFSRKRPMNTSLTRSTSLILNIRQPGSLAALAIVCVIVLLTEGCARDRIEPQAFASPEQAVQALTDTLRADDTTRLRAIMGSEGEPIISSGDPIADRQGRQKFLAFYDEKHSLLADSEDSRSLVIGNSEWPFPVPIVRQGQAWVFGAEAGKEEILNRRIGTNELSAIKCCKAIADAQHEYALSDPNNDGVHEYAQMIHSDPGKKNGLYWPTAESETPSPLGELMAAAAGEGYVRKGQGPTPYHGYCYRILCAQGPSAPNGAMDYVGNGKMILGFAVVAYPAEYGNSGIMTFIMGDDGVVYQKDLGEQTAELGAAMKAFDPGEGWKKVE
jgi:hypothetical protein